MAWPLSESVMLLQTASNYYNYVPQAETYMTQNVSHESGAEVKAISKYIVTSMRVAWE